jgi:hypothetical protein
LRYILEDVLSEMSEEAMQFLLHAQRQADHKRDIEVQNDIPVEQKTFTPTGIDFEVALVALIASSTNEKSP